MTRMRDVHEFVKYIHDVYMPELRREEREAKEKRRKAKAKKVVIRKKGVAL